MLVADPMKSHCYPFRNIPHSSKLFLDYLDFSPPVQAFYSQSPYFLEWAKQEAERVQYPADRRARIATILDGQNKSWGAASRTIENIERFRSGACAIVTGQQVGLFGGPMFSIYKALSAVKLAQEAQKLGIDCVPIFWLATEDHDFSEVNQVLIPSPDGRLETLRSGAPEKANAPVGTIKFGPEISATLERVGDLLGDSDCVRLLTECYRPGENFGSAFAKLFTQLFSDLGVVLLDGADAELDQIAAPLYVSAIQRASEINEALLQRGTQLEAVGYHQQVKVTDSSTLLFLIRDGLRIPIQQANAGEFLAGGESISREQLIQVAASSPQSLSPNVLLRPVVQDYLLPTLAYIGGPAEIAYFAQAGAVYEDLLERTTPVLPRFSATLVEPKTQALLEKNQVSAPDTFRGQEAVSEMIGARRLPANLQNSFEQATAAVQSSMQGVREAIAKLDKTLSESAENAESKMQYQISNLRARASRAEVRQSEVIGRHADVLSNALYPDKTLQEREFGGIYFLAKYGREWMSGLLENIRPDCLNHQIIEI
jgi:bacillithiol synthase